jgi:hypothetical protein
MSKQDYYIGKTYSRKCRDDGNFVPALPIKNSTFDMGIFGLAPVPDAEHPSGFEGYAAQCERRAVGCDLKSEAVNLDGRGPGFIGPECGLIEREGP